MDPPTAYEASSTIAARTRRRPIRTIECYFLLASFSFVVISLFILVPIAHLSVKELNILIDLPPQLRKKKDDGSNALFLNNNSQQDSSKPILFCGHYQWSTTSDSCNKRVNYVTKRYEITKEEAKKDLLNEGNCICETDDQWQRLLIGIFSYDILNEFELRKANRETHLKYFKFENFERIVGYGTGTICSLQEVLTNTSLVSDQSQCQILYTFVMGGGNKDDMLTKKRSNLDLASINKALKTRCLWQDPGCGGEDIDQWTVDYPQFIPSLQLKEELQMNRDITLLNISENHELGKTDTWFTYTAMLTKNRPDLNIRLIGKMDSDNFLDYSKFLGFFHRYDIDLREKKYLYGGPPIYKAVCSGKAFGRLCTKPEFIAPLFIPGALVYLSTPLVQHVYMNGTSLERKKSVWIPIEDMQLGNMVYSDSNINVTLLPHNHGGKGINEHCFSDPVKYRALFSKKIFNVTGHNDV